MKQSCGLAFLLFYLTIINGCTKNYTNYYLDDQDSGLSIFSNTQNQAMSCYVNGSAWRTRNRKTYSGFGGGTVYEIDIFVKKNNSLSDTMMISWNGYFINNPNFSGGEIRLTLPVSKNFSKSFSALQGKRLNVDSSAGFFTSSINVLNGQTNIGTGSIYFHTAQVDSSSTGYIGKMSGLVEARFGNNIITRGRFDHFLDGGNVRVY